MNNMTAREFIKENGGYRSICMEELYDKVSSETLIKFTKYHVKQALEAAKNEVVKDRLSYDGLAIDTENRILNAYNLDNIK